MNRLFYLQKAYLFSTCLITLEIVLYCVGVRPEATKVTIDQKGSFEMFHEESLPEANFNISVQKEQ